MKAAPAAAPNSRSRKIARSSIGARERASIKTNAGSSKAATTNDQITSGSFHAVIPPREIPSTSPVRPSTKATVPGRSSPRTASGRASSRNTNPPHNAPSSPNGTLNQNTHGHEIDTSAPPRTGPKTSPTAATIVFVPIATPSCERGNASVTSAAAFANRNAPPTPCRIRHRMSCVASSAKPAPSDAAANTTNPPTYARFRPKRSDSRPAVSTSTVDAIMYARITHTSESTPACNDRSRSGRAMISVPELIVASSIPRLVHESAHHL